MNAQPFALASCPSVPVRRARATLAALRAGALLPASWAVDMPPLGSATMFFAGYDSAREASDGVELAVGFGVGRARLAVEPAFATRLVDTVLGGGSVFSAARAAGPAERGILAGVLAPAFDRIGGAVQLDPVPPARERRERSAAPMAFRLETVIASGFLHLTPPPAADLSPGTRGVDVWRARAGRIPVTGRIEIAATGVPAGALAGVAVGDALVFEGVRSSAFSGAGAWSARLCVGEHAAAVTVDAAGQLSIVGGFSPVPQQEGYMSASGSNTDATTVLAAASIEVVAELGRITLRGDELLGLAPGAVLAVGTSRNRVALRVAGEVWAEGEIVDIDGELGVRVTRVVNR